ncbi:MAG TPA: protein translocase subunit SecF [Acidimicrobiia bacterium]|jgi:preprotein translocase subunit SecF
MRADGKHHTFKDLYHERTTFDFLHRRWRWALLSGVVLLVGLIAFAANGLNLGIDFTGGTVWELTTKQTPSTGELRSLVEPLGVKDPKIVIVGSKGVRVQGQDLPTAKQTKITEALAKYGGVTRQDVSVSDVGPTWGNTVSSKALRALIIFFLVIALYLSLRFTIKMAVAAIIAVVHDIAITVGVYAITGFEVTPATVIAFLTILGFSLYDTVVVFDKIKENERLVTTNNMTYTDMANMSLNQVLMRSLNTSFVALLPVASLLVVGVWIYGALALRDFGLALFVGLLTGAYSSIFVATPILAWLKEREPKHRAVAARVETKAQRAGVAGPEAQPEPVTAGAGAAAATGAPAPSPAPRPAPSSAPAGAAITPRPRQQRGRKRK